MGNPPKDSVDDNLEKSQPQFNLEAERLRIEELWHDIKDHYAALAVAAARTFHQAQQARTVLVDPDDYHAALDLAATALSRLIPIYGMGVDGMRVKVAPIDLRTQRFARGATEIRSADGNSIENLSVLRSDAVSAIPFIVRTGLTFTR
jgi:DNA-directed RNA polymerase subunit K/omega